MDGGMRVLGVSSSYRFSGRLQFKYSPNTCGISQHCVSNSVRLSFYNLPSLPFASVSSFNIRWCIECRLALSEWTLSLCAIVYLC